MPKHAITVKPYNGLFYFKCSCGHSGVTEKTEELAMKHGLEHVAKTVQKVRITFDTNQFTADKITRYLANLEGVVRVENNPK